MNTIEKITYVGNETCKVTYIDGGEALYHILGYSNFNIGDDIKLSSIEFKDDQIYIWDIDYIEEEDYEEEDYIEEDICPPDIDIDPYMEEIPYEEIEYGKIEIPSNHPIIKHKFSVYTGYVSREEYTLNDNLTAQEALELIMYITQNREYMTLISTNGDDKIFITYKDDYIE